MTMQGVNLGGWLIPEKWLTPSLFEGTDSSDLYGLVRTEQGKARYLHHLETFITEDDFRWLKQHSIGFVRLPVGYWTLESVDGYPSTKECVDWAMDMAAKYDIKILLDLHAARGSQNGEMHSGRRGALRWQQTPRYQAETLKILRALARRYCDHSALWGIELLNEPKMGQHYFTLIRFYRQAYRELIKLLRSGTYVVFHDAFHPLLFTGALRRHRAYPVVMDVHWYAIAPKYTGRLSMKRYGQLQRGFFGVLLRVLNLWQPIMVGEWSSVLPQAMFDRTSKKDHRQLLADNIRSQHHVYRRVLATAYWNYKAEGTGMWNFRSLVESGDLVLQ